MKTRLLVRRWTIRLCGLLIGVSAFGTGAVAPTLKQAAGTDSGTAPPSSSPAEPQQTSASFGDWVVRCQQAAARKKVCEVAQTLIMSGQQAPIAQIAFGGEGAQTVTVLLPTNIAFDKPPQLSLEGTQAAVLAFRRCMPGGCLADAKIDASQLKAIEAAAKPARLSFTDAAEQTLALPLSLRGFPEAVAYFNSGAAAR